MESGHGIFAAIIGGIIYIAICAAVGYIMFGRGRND